MKVNIKGAKHLRTCPQIVGFMAAVLLYSSGSHADEPEVNYFLPEIVVRAEAQTASMQTTNKWLVDREDLIAFNAVTVADGLRYQPGLNIQYGASSAEARVWIRGFRDRDVLVLYDGVPIASAYEGTIDLNELSSGPIQRIHVSKAAPSVIYGTNGVGGVVDVIPRAAEATPTEIRAEVGQEQTGVIRATTAFATSAGSLLMSAGYAMTDGYPMSEDSQTTSYQDSSLRTNADFERADILLRGTTAFSSLGETAITFMQVSANKSLPPGLGPDSPKFERLTQSDRRSLILSQQLGDAVAVKGYYNEYDFTLASYVGSDYAIVEDTESGSDKAYGLRAYGSFNLADEYEILLATSFSREEYTADNTFLNSESESVDTYSLASEYSWSSSESALSWRAGLIATYFEGSNDTSVTAFNPQAAFDYKFAPTLTLTGSFAQRTRMPKLGELYEARYGNPDLRELQSNNAELTLTTALGGHSLSVSVFYNDIDGLIEKPARQLPWQNLDDTVIKGIEMSGLLQLSSNLTLGLGGAWVDAQETTPSGDKRQIRSRPEFSGYADLRGQFGNVAVSVRGEYVDRLYDVTKRGAYIELDTYLVFSAKAAWQVTDSLSVYLNCANVTDTAYEQKLGFPREGRDVRLGATFTFW